MRTTLEADRPRSSSLSGVRVRARESDERPPIIELKDIFENEPVGFASGAVLTRSGPVLEAVRSRVFLEEVRSRALMLGESIEGALFSHGLRDQRLFVFVSSGIPPLLLGRTAQLVRRLGAGAVVVMVVGRKETDLASSSVYIALTFKFLY